MIRKKTRNPPQVRDPLVRQSRRNYNILRHAMSPCGLSVDRFGNRKHSAPIVVEGRTETKLAIGWALYVNKWGTIDRVFVMWPLISFVRKIPTRCLFIIIFFKPFLPPPHGTHKHYNYTLNYGGLTSSILLFLLSSHGQCGASYCAL